MTVPPPPSPFDPIVETLPAGSLFFRVHEPVLPGGIDNDGTMFNPGFGKPTRFAFFGAPVVPIIYAADKPEGAVHESILHEAEPGMFIPGRNWRSKVLTALTLTRDVPVARLHSDGLRRLGIFASDLTDTDLNHYSDTVRWAEAAWSRELAGVSYMCRHYNSSMAVCLFEDRLPPGTLQVEPAHPETRAFTVPRDAEWLAQIALDIRVVIRPR